MRLTKRQKILSVVALGLVAMLVVIWALFEKPALKVAFVRYEENGRFVVLRVANYTKSGLSCFMARDSCWKFDTIPPQNIYLPSVVVLDSGENCEVRLRSSNSSAQRPSKIQMRYQFQPGRMRRRLNHLVSSVTGADLPDKRRVLVWVDLPSVTNAVINQQMDATQ